MTSSRYGKFIGAFIAVGLIGLVGAHGYQSHQLEVRARAIGWQLDVPWFGSRGYFEPVAESERLRVQAASIEEQHDVVLPYPYSEYWLRPVGEWLQDMSRVGMDVTKFDFTSVDMTTWLNLRPLLKVRNIPPGTFQMGCTQEQGEACHDWERPVHSVSISTELYMMQHEVTQGLFELVMGYNPSFHQGEALPVEQVSWGDAARFANRLSEMDGLPPCYVIEDGSVEWADKACTGWRLPTEAEWEYAARANQVSRYSGSDSLENVGWYYANSQHQSHAVCTKQRNGFGLCDMSGNVWEWVWDWYGEYGIEGVADPTGPVSGRAKVLRGGSWRHYERNSRVSIRYYIAPEYTNPSWGFRLIRSG